MRKSDTVKLTSDKSKWFHYRQNNSGGTFVIDDAAGLGPEVYIEAYDSDHADERAEQLGIYFDGVNEGSDCECCGDRWYNASRYSDDPFSLSKYSFFWHDTVYVHQLESTDGNKLRRLYKDDQISS